MCQYFSKEELEECCKNPNFCVVCLSTRVDVDKHHVCKDCQNENAG